MQNEYLQDSEEQDVLRYALTLTYQKQKDFTWKDFQARNTMNCRYFFEISIVLLR
jgi:hypothetical protein